MYDLAEEIHHLHLVITKGIERFTSSLDWHKSLSRLATKKDLELLQNKIMANQTDIAAQLRAAEIQLKKIAVEIDSVQTAVNLANEKILELEKLITDGAATEELVAAADAVKNAIQEADDKIPDLPSLA